MGAAGKLGVHVHLHGGGGCATGCGEHLTDGAMLQNRLCAQRRVVEVETILRRGDFWWWDRVGVLVEGAVQPGDVAVFEPSSVQGEGQRRGEEMSMRRFCSGKRLTS